MNRRQVALALRHAIERVLPDADSRTQRRWFCRVCAVRYLAVNGLPADRLPVRLPLFAGCPERLPDALVPALEILCSIPDAEWQDAPSLLGWLYQYSNAPEREAALRGLRSHEKITPDRIPAATQLFTPDWIVKCMVQNSLGTLCAPLPSWTYFLQTQAVDLPKRSPSDITLLDPCMGTGHILAYAFDALMEQYLADGWAADTAALRILTHNLHGLDIDREAALLCDFVLRMKAAPYLPDILERDIPTQLFHFENCSVENAMLLGSLLRPEAPQDAPCRLLTQQYDAVITNPPYMGAAGMDKALSAYVKANFPAGKADLFACFMERCAELTRPDGCFTMIVQHVWMFLSSFRKLREFMESYTLRDLVHLGTRAFSTGDVGTIVQTAVFTAFGREMPDYPTLYLRLTESQEKESAFHDPALRYVRTKDWFDAVPGKPLCYWMSSRVRELMQHETLGSCCRICQGMTTSDNKRFVRRWYEVKPSAIAFGCKDAAAAAASGKKWFPYNKGGRLRRWYGNHSFVVNYENNGAELRAFHADLNRRHSGGRLKNADTYFRAAVTWPFITESSRFGVRLQPEGFLFDVAGSCLFPAQEDLEYLMGLLSSNVTLELLRLCNPTMNFQPENLKSLPLLDAPERREEITALVRENIALARADWDSSEESWDFACDPLLLQGEPKLCDAYRNWEQTCLERIARTDRNEMRLNQIFAEIYGLADELPDTPPPTTLTCPTPMQAAEALISYLVGCLFGRYSCEGVTILAENFLPLRSLPERLTDCLRSILGAESLDANICWLEDALGMSLMQYCVTKLHAAHCRMFHKRPLYWLAVSGKKRDVLGLAYVHRFGKYPAQEIAGIVEHFPSTPERLDYLSRLQAHKFVPYVPDDGIAANLKKFQGVFRG